MANILLINCPILMRRRQEPALRLEGDEYSNTHLGILYIAASLRKEGFSVTVLDPHPQNLCLEDVIDIIKKNRPILIGFSVMTSSIRTAVKLSSEIRNALGNEPLICIGGAHINIDPEFISRFPNFDFAVVGEAEITIVELAREIEKGKRPKGIIYAKPIDNLDVLPFPARDLVDIRQYRRPEERKRSLPAATMITSRGCPFQCIFCSRAAFRKKLRVRSPKNVVDEMESIAREHGNRFTFVDDTLTLDRKAILGVCDEIVRRKLNFKWMGMTRADCLDDELARKLRKAGCDELFIGVESGNERIRNEIIKKNMSDKTIFDAVKICRKNDINIDISLIIGFPTETNKEINDTINFGRRCKADIMGIRILIPLPGSDIFDYAVKKCILPKDLADKYARGELGEGFAGVWPLFVPEGLTMRDLIIAKKKAYINFYLNPAWILRRILFYIRHPYRIRGEIGLLMILPHVLRFGKTKGSIS